MGRVQKPAGTSRDCHYVDMKTFFSRLSIFIVHFVLVVARCGLAAGEIETSWYFWLGMAFVDFVPSSTITFTVTTNHDYLDINYGMLRKSHCTGYLRRLDVELHREFPPPHIRSRVIGTIF